jgi:hypothetical protein
MMATIQLTIKTNQGDHVVEARTCGVPGLAVHRDPFDRSQWVVSHSRSGYRLDGALFRTRSEAMAAAGRLAGLANWSAPRSTLRLLPDLGQQVRRALEDSSPGS